jgi:hypothetical protein
MQHWTGTRGSQHRKYLSTDGETGDAGTDHSLERAHVLTTGTPSCTGNGHHPLDASQSFITLKSVCEETNPSNIAKRPHCAEHQGAREQLLSGTDHMGGDCHSPRVSFSQQVPEAHLSAAVSRPADS